MMFDDVLSDLEKQTKLPKEELNNRISKKQRELSGLISLEGAAQLVARELGMDTAKRKLEIKDIVEGMKNVSFVGRIFKISPITEFKKLDDVSGRVTSLLVGDSTDSIRLTLWNDQVKLVEEAAVGLGGVIQVSNSYAKENKFGNVEVTLGKYGSVKLLDNTIMLPSLNELTKRFLSNSPEKISLKDVRVGNLEISGNIVQIFQSNFIFFTCSICNNHKCSEHSKVEQKPELVVSCLVDDETSILKVVFFRELAEKTIGSNAREINSLPFDDRFKLIKDRLLGKEIIVSGRVRKNNKFNRFEMVADNFKDLNALDESKKLIEEIELSIGG